MMNRDIVTSTNDFSAPMPSPVWFEGVLDHFRVEPPYDDPNDHRRIGFGLSRQITGLYLIEILLKRALEERNAGPGIKHNLPDMFRKLDRATRKRIERKYAALLAHSVEWTWDVCETVESTLNYFGTDAFTDTRYFWSRKRSDSDFASILFMTGTVDLLVRTLFTELFGYPEQGAPQKRFRTRFVSLKDSLENDRDDPEQPY